MTTTAPTRTTYDVARVRADFPILGETVHDKPLVFLDSAASAQKPRAVIDAERFVYEHAYSNVHRGVHTLSMRATDLYEGARAKVRDFLGARDVKEVVFVRSTTEAINLVAQTYGRKHVGAGDEVLISALEHHSNIVPWQMLCEEKGAHLRGGAHQRRGRGGARGARGPAHPAHQDRGRGPRLERARDRQPGRGHRRSAPTHRASPFWWTAPRAPPMRPST